MRNQFATDAGEIVDNAENNRRTGGDAMTADQELSARLADQMNRLAKEKSPSTMDEAILDVMDGACGDAYRSGQLITLADHERAVQAAVAKAVDDTLDAAHEYTNKTYNMQFLSHPVDRQRIATAIRSRGVAG